VEAELEFDQLNSMPTMETMTRVLEFTEREYGDEIRRAGGVPDHMDAILNKLQNQTHRNIHWFIIKLILNCKDEVFKPYARYFFPHIVAVVVQPWGFTWGFHYLIRDLCELFLDTWKGFLSDGDYDCQTAASRWVNHLISISGDIGSADNINRKLDQNTSVIERFVKE